MGLEAINQEQFDQFVQVLKTRLNELNQELKLPPNRRRLDREIEFDKRLINQSLNSILQYKTRKEIRVGLVKHNLFGLETPRLFDQFIEELEKQQSQAPPEIVYVETKPVLPPVLSVPEKQPEPAATAPASTAVIKEPVVETPIQDVPVISQELVVESPAPKMSRKRSKPLVKKQVSSASTEIHEPEAKVPAPVIENSASSIPPGPITSAPVLNKLKKQPKPAVKTPVSSMPAEIDEPVVHAAKSATIEQPERILETPAPTAVKQKLEPVVPAPIPKKRKEQPKPAGKVPAPSAPADVKELAELTPANILEKQPEPVIEEEKPVNDIPQVLEIATPNPEAAPPNFIPQPVVQPAPAEFVSTTPKVQSLQEAWLADGATGLAQQLEQEDPWGKASRWTLEDKVLLRKFLASCLEKLEEDFLGWNFVLSKISPEDALYQRLVGKQEKLKQKFRDEIKKHLQTDPQSGLRSLGIFWTKYPLDQILKHVILEFLDYEFLFKDEHAEKTHEIFNGMGKLPRALKERIRLCVRHAKYYRMYPFDPEKAYNELLDKLTRVRVQDRFTEEETKFVDAVRRSWFNQAFQKEDLAALQKVLALLPKEKWVEAEVVALGDLNKMYFQSVRSLVDNTSKAIQKGEQIERQRVGLAAKLMKNLQRQHDINETLQEWNDLIDDLRTWIEKTRQAGWNYECLRLENSLEKLIRIYSRVEQLRP